MIRSVPETRSTNDDVAALARDGAREGTWLRADRQTGGRGRQGREWRSPPGNLYASTLVRVQPGDPPAHTLALTAAVALHEIIGLYAPDAALLIKWPNDILAGGAKLSGILLERSGDAVVIGFGVNLAHYPETLERPTTSVAALAGVAPDPAAFLDALADAFARWLGRWRNEGLRVVRDRWLAASHPIGTALTAAASGEKVEGLFDGLDETGALRLRIADGSTRIINAGDVFLI
ncbi:biotin--[acetyl-CoA-carboxylase] ligase [Allosphingosinicella flava]|uniref:biotin--[biotin carboxyl-carrier protein] ligase n=1 Tax=Allosphingosinicella flava TaxID=2771430 RepID=A0A7T2GLX3_9SPHN|nr:biotin--[acetyl-CoA-carboxylase] ligase [Sphingosinicella flava]QPQ56207.1 biotin--[acetyl-CoA-carboxylase] ligase [Sphingosinicella flava]